MLIYARGAMVGVQCDGDKAQGDPERGCDQDLVFDQPQRLSSVMRRVARLNYRWKYKRWNGKMYDFCRWHAQKYRG